MRDDVDLVVVGAGVVGCAVTERAARCGQRVVNLEAAAREGEGVTSRNSGVLHSGLHHPPTWLKTRLCVRGRGLLGAWLVTHQVPHEVTGKLIIASTAEELEAVDDVHQRALGNGADVQRVTVREARALEPGLGPCAGALWCPDSGIVDSHALTKSLRVAAQHAGADVVFGATVQGAAPWRGGWALETTRGALRTRRVINAAGLSAVAVARLFGVSVPSLRYCRGDYFGLRTRTRYRRLIYPVRAAGAAGLGVHLTLDLGGRVRLGPDTEWVEDPADLGPGDREQTKLDTFHERGQRLLGAFPRSALRWDSCGIRPKLGGPRDGEADFEVLRRPSGDTHLLGIESPGLTAALALAEFALNEA